MALGQHLFCVGLVDLACQEKTKLKFELFLNGRRSGAKVMLGQKFSYLEQEATRGSWHRS